VVGCIAFLELIVNGKPSADKKLKNILFLLLLLYLKTSSLFKKLLRSKTEYTCLVGFYPLLKGLGLESRPMNMDR